jgi:TonB-linked SusC/RagA family outer membrane protein
MKNVLPNPCRSLCIKSSQVIRIFMMAGILCLMAFAQVNAQSTGSSGQITVRGKVTDAKGVNLPGVAIQIKGTQSGTTTDTQGGFSLSAPSNGTLVATYLGYTTQEVLINGKTSVDITLIESQQSLDEVVVTAFGVTKERRGLVSSVQEVKGDQFTQARDNNIATALTGRIAGLDAAQINAGPGASSKVTIRGANIIGSGGNNQPLYVVDGLPIRNPSSGAANGAQSFNVDRGDGISMINPDDIESISVLKGGAAAALYGSQAANGVILITTKSGKSQTGIGVEVNSVANVHTPSIYPVYQYIYGQGQPLTSGAWVVPSTQAIAQASGRLSFGPKMDPNIQYVQVDGQMHPYTAQNVKDNIKNFYDIAKDFTNSVAFSGGNQQFTVRLGLTDVRSNAQQPNSTFNRQGGVLTTSAKLGKNNIISVSGNLNYTVVQGKNRPNVGYAEYSADWPVYLIANTVDIRSLSPGITSSGQELAWNLAQEAPNPYFVVNYMENGDKSQRFIAGADVKINFLKNLSLDIKANRDFQLQDNYNYTPLLKNSQPNGAYASNFSNNWATNIYTTLMYNASFLKDFNLNTSIGGTQARSKSLSSQLSGTNWVIPNFFSTSNLGIITTTSAGNIRSEGKGGTNSALGTLDLDWKKIVYINLTGRNDWFSQLNRGTNSIFYPSIGTSVIVSDLVKMPKKFDMLKVRGSWARVGLATVSASQVRQAYSISTNNIYGLPTLGVSSSLLNPTLRPLHVDTWEGGFETQLLGSRLGLDATYYNKTSHDDILNLTLSSASGYSGGNGNVGSIRNQGLEIVLTGTPIRKSNFTWNTNLNFTLNRSKVVELAPSISEISLGTGVQGPKFVSKPGLPYSTLEGNVMAQNAAGQIIYSTTNNFPLTMEVPLGSGYQPYLYGMVNDLKYKQFTMSFQLDGKFGGVAFTNQEQYATRFGLTMESLPGRETGLPVTGVDQNGAPYSYTYKIGTDLYNYYNRASTYTGQFVHSNDFVKLRRFTLSYNIPVNKIKAVKLRNASISLVGSNLLNLYQIKVWKDLGIDYEQQESSDNGQGGGGVSAPHTRVWGANLRVSF